MSSGTRPSTINRPVFFPAAVFTLLLVGFAILAPRSAQSLFETVQGWILGNASWFYGGGRMPLQMDERDASALADVLNRVRPGRYPTSGGR